MARGFRKRLAGVEIADLDKIESLAGNAVGSPTAAGSLIAAGVYDVSAADATANSMTIATGLTSITSAIVQVIDGGNNVVTADADVTFSGGSIVVADGSTFNTTATYFVRWIAFGA